MAKKIIIVVALLLMGVGTWLALSEASSEEARMAEKRSPDRFSSGKGIVSSDSRSGLETASPLPAASPLSAASSLNDSAEDEPQTEEEKAEAAAEAKVESFDDLTDKWMEPTKAGVTMKDVDGFVAAFRQVPKDRQDECIHRALNLVPDENVMLLAGVLMDKSMDKAIVETVFNDVLNRDEDVKKPILQQIFKDKTHPCWADTAWILDVTGETPEKAP